MWTLTMAYMSRCWEHLIPNQIRPCSGSESGKPSVPKNEHQWMKSSKTRISYVGGGHGDRLAPPVPPDNVPLTFHDDGKLN